MVTLRRHIPPVTLLRRSTDIAIVATTILSGLLQASYIILCIYIPRNTAPFFSNDQVIFLNCFAISVTILRVFGARTFVSHDNKVSSWFIGNSRSLSRMVAFKLDEIFVHSCSCQQKDEIM